MTLHDRYLIGNVRWCSPGPRPMHPDWARSLRDQCAAARVPYLFKQQGGWVETGPEDGGDLGADMRADRVRVVKRVGENDGHLRRGDVFMRRVGKKAAGRLLDGIEHNGFPESGWVGAEGSRRG